MNPRDRFHKFYLQMKPHAYVLKMGAAHNKQTIYKEKDSEQ